MKTRVRKTESKERRKRARPTPRWLLKTSELDSIAQRRCVMLLDVLSGARPVTEAIAEAQISRPMYYQMEERALKAMLLALTPGASETSSEVTTSGQISQLQDRVKTLETEKRRAERLLLLTRKMIRPGTLKTAPGRPVGSRNRRNSADAGRKSSPKLSRPATPTETSTSTSSPSTPTKDGAAAP